MTDKPQVPARQSDESASESLEAAAVAAISQGWMHSPVTLDLPGGRLTIEWEGPGRSVIMTGPAMRVYEGQVRL